jgi:hypothetical protein
MELITIPFEVFKSNWDAEVSSSQGGQLDKAIADLKSTYAGCFTGNCGSHHRGMGGFGNRGGGGGGGGERNTNAAHRSETGGERNTSAGHWGNERGSYKGHSNGYGGGGGGTGSHRRGGFKGGYEGGGGHGHGHHRRVERPRIGIREFSREDISRKDFMANMNKMSRQNYEAILRHIRTTYNSNFLENYMDIVWAMMTRQMDYQDLYILVIQHLLQITPTEKKGVVLEYWNDRCKTYFETHAWMPTMELLDSMSEEYDEFCDYIKWKKLTGASLTAWLRLMSNGIVEEQFELCFDTMMKQTEDAIQQSSPRLLDCFLEWLLRMVGLDIQYIYPESYIVQLNDWMSTIKDRGMSSALRFKITDIIQCISSKQK